MKKGIEIWSDYDSAGRWCLRIKKAKGRFTLDELTEILREYEMDFYALIINAMDGESAQYYDDAPTGDYVTCYSATDFFS